MDKFPTAPEIMDLIWGKWITAKYTKILAIFIRQNKDAMAACFEQGIWTKRIDLDEQVPYNGIDKNGNLCEPTEAQHWEYHHDKYVRGANEDNAHRREFDDYMKSFKMNLLCQKMIVYCIRCGITHRELKDTYNIDPEEKVHTMTEEALNERRKLAQGRLSEQRMFTRRIIRGALGINKYSYFQSDITNDFPEALYMDPHALLIAIPKQIRLISALHVCKNYGVALNPALDKQLRNAISSAHRNKDGLVAWGALLDKVCHNAVMDRRFEDD